MKQLLFAVLAGLAVPAGAAVISGRIVAVNDGDTLTIESEAHSQSSVRLLAADAPARAQDFGERATANLSAMAFHRLAQADCPKLGRDGTPLCRVVVEGQDLGLEQIRAGMAWWYRPDGSQQSPDERAEYERAEFQAKLRRYGLWNSKNPVPPWDWGRVPARSPLR